MVVPTCGSRLARLGVGLADAVKYTGLGHLQRNFFVSTSLSGLGDHLNVFLCLSRCPKHPRSLIFAKIINFDTSCQIRQFISSNEGREIAGDIIEIAMK